MHRFASKPAPTGIRFPQRTNNSFEEDKCHANQTLDQRPTDRRRRPRPTRVQPGPRSRAGGNQRSQRSPGRCRRARRRCRVRQLVANPAERALAAAAQTRRRHRSPWRRAGQTGIGQLRQALQRRAERRDPGDCRRVPFLRRRQPLHERFGGWRIPAGPHLDDPPRPGGRDRLHRAVELPADDGRLENRPGPGRR